MNLPTDLEILTEIYERYYDEFKNFSQEQPTRECRVYVPIDIRAMAKNLNIDEYILFGRFYNYLNEKYKGNEESPLFCMNVGKDKHAIHFPLLASVLAGLQEESKKQRPQKLETASNVITSTNSTVVVGDSNAVASKTLEVNIPNKKAWHEKVAFKLIIPFLSSLLVAYLVYYFRWK